MKRFTTLILTAALALGAQAQDAKVSKEREALRRAQIALRAAQEQQSALQADKAKAEADTVAAHKEAAGAKAQIATAAAKLKVSEAELDALRTQLQAAKQAQQVAEVKATEREQALQQQVIASRQEGASRLQSNQAPDPAAGTQHPGASRRRGQEPSALCPRSGSREALARPHDAGHRLVAGPRARPHHCALRGSGGETARRAGSTADRALIIR